MRIKLDSIPSRLFIGRFAQLPVRLPGSMGFPEDWIQPAIYRVPGSISGKKLEEYGASSGYGFVLHLSHGNAKTSSDSPIRTNSLVLVLCWNFSVDTKSAHYEEIPVFLSFSTSFLATRIGTVV